jgi:hypothetical protein
VSRVRATVPGDDAGARAFFAAAGFAVDAIVMEVGGGPTQGQA